MLSILFTVKSNILFASEHQNLPQTEVPDNVTIPPPYLIGTEDWLPSINQFVITPQDGALVVQYTGIFNSSTLVDSASDTKVVRKIILPLPKYASIQRYVEIMFTGQMQQIHETFTLPAKFGTFHWEAGDLPVLPGVTLIILNDRSAKISLKSANFIYDSSQNSEGRRQYVRVSRSKDVEYPEFYLTSLIPSRMFIYIAVSVIGLALFSILLIFGKINKSSK